MGYNGWKHDEEFDWDKVQKRAPPVLDHGIYSAVVTKAEAVPTKKDGSPSIQVVLEINGKFDSKEQIRRVVFDTLTATQEGAFRFAQFSDATGIDRPRRNRFQDIEDYAAEMLGKELWVLLRSSAYEGRQRNKVDVYLSEDEAAEEQKKLVDAEGGPRRPRGQTPPRQQQDGASTRSRRDEEVKRDEHRGHDQEERREGDDSRDSRGQRRDDSREPRRGRDTEDLDEAPSPREEPRRARREGRGREAPSPREEPRRARR